MNYKRTENQRNEDAKPVKTGFIQQAIIIDTVTGAEENISQAAQSSRAKAGGYCQYMNVWAGVELLNNAIS